MCTLKLFVQSCAACIKGKWGQRNRASLFPIMVTILYCLLFYVLYVLYYRLGIDIVSGLSVTAKRNICMIGSTDFFPKGAEIYPAPNHIWELGVIERVNGTIVNLLRTEAQEDQRHWDTYIPSLQLAINSAVYSSTEF